MRTKLLTILGLAAGALCSAASAQTSTLWVAVYSEARILQPLKLGPAFRVVGDQLNVVTPSAPAAGVERKELVLAWDDARKGWPLPPGASNIAVYVNGLRYHAGNWSVEAGSGLLKPRYSNMQPTHEILLDYDVPVR